MNCLNCTKEIKVGKYCSVKCQQKYQSNKIVENWLHGKIAGHKAGFVVRRPIRLWLIEQSNFKCEECGWDKKNPITGNSPLEIDHIDGNAENSKRENLRVLCPNCHSLTPTWKALNMGNASKERLRFHKLI